ncbi:sigma 54-interacting transcriptional regulator [Oleispirillum naphthae]|uniref:sigma 54-interacting transcriptional regulator n=1 Tax=Oleispirillum naphthae TaxID=2838853 RepID=UPI0030825CB7
MKLHPYETLEQPIHIALVETSQRIDSSFRSIAERCGVVPHTFTCPFSEIPGVAREMEGRVDAIMCRAGTAEYVSRSVSIPVVAIPITSFDVMSAMYNLKKPIRKAAIFCHRKVFSGIDLLEKMFDCKIYQYEFSDDVLDEIDNGARNALSLGVEYCFGGGITYECANKYNMTAVKISPNEDSIFRSVNEALRVARVRRQERGQAAWLTVLFDSISEGIMVTDNESKIVVCNGAAKKIWRISGHEATGKKVDEVLRISGMAVDLKPEEQEINFLETIYGKTFAIRKTPVLLDGNLIGTVSTFEDITKIQHLEEMIRNQMRNKGLIPRYNFDDILSRNAAMVDCKKLAARYASTQASVVIEGESGTGKELFAQSIHTASDRASGPFVAVNCAAIPEALLESELFGYEGGAFTGARREGRQGLFEQAHKGTIFLDEISEIPAALQARLLRVLQEREVRRVGGDKIIPVDIRIISATNRNLWQKVEQGLFREDLFYRLNVLYLQIPPLRERRDDIGILSESILRRFGVHPPPEALAAITPILMAYDWPGNIRELSNILERLSLLVTDARSPGEWAEISRQILKVPARRESTLHVALDMEQDLKGIVRSVEKEVLHHMLAKYNNDSAMVAEKLKIGRTSMWRKVKYTAS